MNKSRDQWSSKMIFIFAAVGAAVGLGNVWRFPFLVGKYGGGAFLIPYLIMLCVMGVPLLILEFAVGQKMQAGAVKSFQKIHPALAGVGLCAVLCGFVISCYYAVVMAWSMLYTFFAFKLSWGEDTHTFFFKDVLHTSASINEMGAIVPSILVALVACWVLVYFSVWKGVKSVGKVVAITMPLPIIILVILLFRGISLPGSTEGIIFYLKPNFSALLDREVWIMAMSQIFFTLTIGFGVMIAYASYQDPKSDITKSAYITAILNSCISLVSGFVVFSTLGYMSLKSGVSVAELAAAGPSLAFIVFPQALSMIPGASFFAVLFFIMLLTLAIDSAFSLVEAVAAIFCDLFPKVKKESIVLYICMAGFLGGILFTTYAGIHYLDLVDHFITSYGLVIVGLFQCIAVGWFYGAKKLRTYINEVSDIKIGAWWDFSIKYMIPIALIFMLGSSIYDDVHKPYGGYPSWAISIFGWGLLATVLSISFLFPFFAKKLKK